MPVETLHPEIIPFISNWTGKLPGQVAEELASHSLETRRIPDPYYFGITVNGELISLTARYLVKDTVEDKISHLGRLEYQAVLAIEQWAAGSDEGSIVWISPPYQGIYPVSKIIVSEIERQDGIKRLFNRAIILDMDEKKCLGFAQDLAQFSQNRPLLSHLDQVRATPLILNTRGGSWICILQELIDDPVLWQSIREGEDKAAKEKALAQAGNVYQGLTDKNLPPEDARRQILGMLGAGSGSCPVVFKSTAFQVFSGSSLLTGGRGTGKDSDFCRNCPVCGTEINCIVRAGQSCPSCKTVKRCG